MDLTGPRSTPSELATIATLNSHIDLLKKVEEQPSISATTSHIWSVAKWSRLFRILVNLVLAIVCSRSTMAQTGLKRSLGKFTIVSLFTGSSSCQRHSSVLSDSLLLMTTLRIKMSQRREKKSSSLPTIWSRLMVSHSIKLCTKWQRIERFKTCSRMKRKSRSPSSTRFLSSRQLWLVSFNKLTQPLVNSKCMSSTLKRRTSRRAKLKPRRSLKLQWIPLLPTS